MKLDRRISQIIDLSTPDIASGKETVESILMKYPEDAPEIRPQLEAVVWLIDAKKNLEPRQGFIPSTRTGLERRLDTIHPKGAWQRLYRRYTPGRWAFNVTAPVILVILLALIVNSFILTARLSIPGDPLYSSKLVLEDLRLALTFNRADKTALYIQYSRERTTEFVELVLEGNYQVLPSAASHMETEIIAALRSIQSLSYQDIYVEQPMASEMRTTLSNEIFMLNILQHSSPPSAYPGIEIAINIAQNGLLALR